jgi:hypothetical protein
VKEEEQNPTGLGDGEREPWSTRNLSIAVVVIVEE